MQIWMLTIPTKELSKRELLFRLRRRAKRWQFGIEVGTNTGYEHYQIRYECSNSDFAEERRYWTGIKCELQQAGGWSEYECKDGNFYSSMDDYLGKYRFSRLKSIQLFFDSRGRKQGDRKITVIIDKSGGGIGKTFWGRWEDLNGTGTYIDGTDPNNIIRDIFDILESNKIRGVHKFIIDLSRADRQDTELFARLETLKNGYLNDGRYSYRRIWIQPPVIFVLTNKEPNFATLSKDRWDKIFVNRKYRQEWICKELEFGD